MPDEVVIVSYGHRPYPVPVGEAVGGRVTLFGWALKESTGSASAELDIYNGGGTNGQLVAPIALNAGQSTREYWGPEGIRMPAGMFQNATSGTAIGSVFVCDCSSHPGEF